MTTTRPAGSIVETQTARGTSYALRFRVGGKRVHQHVGYSSEGVTRDQAERALAFELERVRRGEWKTPAKVQPPPAKAPRFHVFATEWMERREAEGKRPRSIEDLRWALTYHLLGYFEGHRLSDITPAEVDRYVRFKLGEGKLGPSSINKTIGVLAPSA
jgi:hypothetical protein